ncbi:MAG: hypothetical protein KAI24_13585 [Planctomycetes bacterium]|nr:hypothetical protein [Planctomycetota bacterium]
MKIRILIALGALAALSGIWFVAGKLHRFAYWIGHKSDAEVQALQRDGWQVDRLPVDDGVELVGLVRPPSRPDASDARWLLFVPGNSASLLDGFQQVLDELRGDDDVGLAFWAYRGFDASGGAPTPAALRRDLMRQWRRLQELGATAANTEIWGYSLGSMLAPHLAAELCDAGTPPKRLVLIATGSEIAIRPHGLFGRFRASDRYEAASAAARVTCPVVVAHGSDDDALPIAGARALAERMQAQFVEIDGRGHADLWREVRAEVW